MMSYSRPRFWTLDSVLHFFCVFACNYACFELVDSRLGYLLLCVSACTLYVMYALMKTGA